MKNPDKPIAFSALQRLGGALTELLDDDHWNNIEKNYLLPALDERESLLKEIELLRKEKHDALQCSRENVAWFETLKADFDTLHDALVKIAAWADSSDTTPCEVIASRALETLK